MIGLGAPPVIHWSHPDRAPYLGTFDRAVAAFAIPQPPHPMNCGYRSVWNGERFAAMMFGRDRVEYNVIADTDDWPVADTRLARDCWYLAAGREYHLVKPLVCGNWALEVLPVAGWRPGAAPAAGGWHSATDYGSGGDTGWTAGGYGWGAYGLPGGFGVPVSYEAPAASIAAPGETAAGVAGNTGARSSIFPSGVAGGSGGGDRVAVPEPPGLPPLLIALLALAGLRHAGGRHHG